MQWGLVPAITNHPNDEEAPADLEGTTQQGMMRMANEIEIDGRKYRALALADRWAKSEFEYFHEGRNEWRRVNNWDRRERLFSAFSEAA